MLPASGQRFLPTPSARRATFQLRPSSRIIWHFYPRPPRGGRHLRDVQARSGGRFLPTPSARRATPGGSWCRAKSPISTHALREEGDLFICYHCIMDVYFYPRPPRGGRRDYSGPIPTFGGISTHALREEGDWYKKASVYGGLVISTHALREEGDRFSPTRVQPAQYFYPRPPRGGRPQGPAHCSAMAFISTHALREEGDPRGERG